MLSEYIFKKRTEKKLTLRELGSLAGFSYTTVNNIESGKTKDPGIEILEGLAIALEVPIEELITAWREREPAIAKLEEKAEEILLEKPRKITHIPSHLADYIVKKQKEKKISIRELGRRAGISYTAIQNILNGNTQSPGIEILAGLAKALKIPLIHLVLAWQGKDPGNVSQDVLKEAFKRLYTITPVDALRRVLDEMDANEKAELVVSLIGTDKASLQKTLNLILSLIEEDKASLQDIIQRLKPLEEEK
ncbi:MAG: helix-turn-helix transcriptional regulator [Cyanobacteria bacterium P01_H01_bin.74]